ncbi:PIG-L family deacetylase [Eubacteriaceae bacterium ES2]|nr:PIG-L family deacetylase [Eubacteriaceae bacterium ES2]
MKQESILLVAPHPDDETLGAGGYILKQKKDGNKVFVLNMTHMSEDYGYSLEKIIKRNNEIKEMIESYSLDGYYNLELKPAGLDTYPASELVKKISEIIENIKPSIIILPYQFDVHSDHRITFELCYSCTKKFRYPYIKKIFMMEILSETEYATRLFEPNYFVDISDYIERKIEILKIFESEVKMHPFPRSEEAIKALSLLRGSMAGVKNAEAFFVLKYFE